MTIQLFMIDFIAELKKYMYKVYNYKQFQLNLFSPLNIKTLKIKLKEIKDLNLNSNSLI